MTFVWEHLAVKNTRVKKIEVRCIALKMSDVFTFVRATLMEIWVFLIKVAIVEYNNSQFVNQSINTTIAAMATVTVHTIVLHQIYCRLNRIIRQLAILGSLSQNLVVKRRYFVGLNQAKKRPYRTTAIYACLYNEKRMIICSHLINRALLFSSYFTVHLVNCQLSNTSNQISWNFKVQMVFMWYTNDV